MVIDILSGGASMYIKVKFLALFLETAKPAFPAVFGQLTVTPSPKEHKCIAMCEARIPVNGPITMDQARECLTELSRVCFEDCDLFVSNQELCISLEE